MTLRLGGMALRDGVLLQGERYWAVAVRRPDGSIEVSTGERVRLPLREQVRAIPLLRGVVRLGESFAVLPAVRRAAGVPVFPQEDPRLLAAAGISSAAILALRSVRRGSPLLKELIATGFALAPVLLTLRDSRLSRYHGAEHKCIAAYESGGESAVAVAREHDRCGSQLVVPLLLTNAGGNLLLRALGKAGRPVPTFIVSLASIGVAMELFSWAATNPDHPVAGVLRGGGLELQRLFTTSEPGEEHLEVANAALRELLLLEGEQPVSA